jgi:hypothetical protein
MTFLCTWIAVFDLFALQHYGLNILGTVIAGD